MSLQIRYLDEKEDSDVLDGVVGDIVQQDACNGQNVDEDVRPKIVRFDFGGIVDQTTLHDDGTVEPDDYLDSEDEC